MKRILASVIIAFSVVALVGVSAKDEKAKCPISGKDAKDDISLNEDEIEEGIRRFADVLRATAL